MPQIGVYTKLKELEDVNIPSPADNQGLTYDSATGKWVPEAVSPGAHAAQHESGGSDEVEFLKLTDRKHAAKHQNTGDDETNVAGLSGELADAQPPKAHATEHESGGDDPIDGGSVVGARFYDAYVCVRDVKNQNTMGGTFTSGAWRTRDINDEQADTAGICSIASNQITLAAGTYRCIIRCPAFYVQPHQARLYNITDATAILYGASAYTYNSGVVGPDSWIAGRFTLATQKTLEIQHRCGLTRANDGFGYPANYASEIYTVAEFWREV